MPYSLGLSLCPWGNRGEVLGMFVGKPWGNVPSLYDYTISDKSGKTINNGTIQNGDTIVLKNGQKANIQMLPAGTLYEVKEQESNKDGYTTKAKGDKGTVPALSAANVTFENHKDAPTQSLTPAPTATPNPTPTLPPYYPPQTGDDSNMGLFIVLGAVAIAAILIILLRKRGKRN